MSSPTTLTSIIFVATYAALAVGRIPGLRVDRAGITLAGSAALLATGVLTLDDALAAVSFDTLALLFGMMVIAAYLKISGFFDLVTGYIATHLSGPFALLAVTIAASGLLSAFLVNDVVCVALTPLFLHVCQRSGRPPVPYLIGLATASNIGSVATITGNPQNILIGTFSHIPYARFAARLAPVAVVGLCLTFVVIALVYGRQLRSGVVRKAPRLKRRPRRHAVLLARSLIVTVAAIVFFFAGKPIASVALVAAGALMLDRIRPERVYHLVDWPLLVMFAGLFVVVHAFEVNVMGPSNPGNLQGWKTLQTSPVLTLSVLAAALSNVISNVPAVLLFKPWMAVMPDQEQAWLTLAMSSTLAGNLTLLGSVANLIVAESARRSGTELSFVEYLKVGVPLTLLTLAFGIIWL